MDIKVTDLAGNSIDGLGARDFVITEDGVNQRIATFEFQRLAGSPAGNAPSSYYILGYYTTNEKQDGQFRRVQVTDINDTTAKVEARSGYYANKQFINANGAAASTYQDRAIPTAAPGFEASGSDL